MNYIPTLHTADTRTKPRPVLTSHQVTVVLSHRARTHIFPAGRCRESGDNTDAASPQKPALVSRGSWGEHQTPSPEDGHTLSIQDWASFIKSRNETPPFFNSNNNTALLSAQPWRGPHRCAHAPGQGVEEGLSPQGRCWSIGLGSFSGLSTAKERLLPPCLGSTSSDIPRRHTRTAWAMCAHAEPFIVRWVGWVCLWAQRLHQHKANG